MGTTTGKPPLYDAEKKILFAGDALKIDFDEHEVPRALSCHKGYHYHIPLTRDELLHYQQVFSTFDFEHVCTPFEFGRGVSQQQAMALINHLLQTEPHTPARSDKTTIVMNEPHLQRVLRIYQDNLPEGKLESFRIDPIDHLGVPIVDVTFLPKPYQRLYNGIGYGETELNARLSAFGEMHEIMAISEAFLSAPRQKGSYQEMVRQQGAEQVIDPLTMGLPVGSPYTPDTPLRWTEVKRLSDDAPAWVPSEFVANIQADVAYPHQLTTAITNGDGAGRISRAGPASRPAGTAATRWQLRFIPSAGSGQSYRRGRHCPRYAPTDEPSGDKRAHGDS